MYLYMYRYAYHHHGVRQASAAHQSDKSWHFWCFSVFCLLTAYRFTQPKGRRAGLVVATNSRNFDLPLSMILV